MRELDMLALSSKIEQEVLVLPSNERLALIDKLIISLNLPTQTDIDTLWAQEAENRITELDEGKVQGIPGEEVFAEMRSNLSK
jgi:putative addiction module component (TIGR02574 family)